jgi:hypothetical protein
LKSSQFGAKKDNLQSEKSLDSQAVNPSTSNAKETTADLSKDKASSDKYSLFHQLAAPKNNTEDNINSEAQSKNTDKATKSEVKLTLRQSHVSFNRDSVSGFEFEEDYLNLDIKLPTIPNFGDNSNIREDSPDQDTNTIRTPTKNMIEPIMPFSAIQNRTIKDYNNTENELSTPASPSEFGLELDEFEKDFSSHDLKPTANTKSDEIEETNNSDSNSNLNEDSFILKTRTLETLQRVRQNLSDLSSSNESKNLSDSNNTSPFNQPKPSVADAKSLLQPASKSSDPLDYLGFNVFKPSSLPNESVPASANDSLAVEASSQENIDISFTKESTKPSIFTLSKDPSPDRRSSFLSSFKPKRFSFIPEPADFTSSNPDKFKSSINKKETNISEQKNSSIDKNRLEGSVKQAESSVSATLTSRESNQNRSKEIENNNEGNAGFVSKIGKLADSRTEFAENIKNIEQIGASNESNETDIISAKNESVIPQIDSQIVTKINAELPQTSISIKPLESSNLSNKPSLPSSKTLDIASKSSTQVYSSGTQKLPETSKLSSNTRLFKSSLFSPKPKLASKLSTPATSSETNKVDSKDTTDKIHNVENAELNKQLESNQVKNSKPSLLGTSNSGTVSIQSKAVAKDNDSESAIDLATKSEISQKMPSASTSIPKKPFYTFKPKTSQGTTKKDISSDTNIDKVPTQPSNDLSKLDSPAPAPETTIAKPITQQHNTAPSTSNKQDPKELLSKRFSLSGSSTLKNFNTSLLKSNLSKDSSKDTISNTPGIVTKDFAFIKDAQTKPTSLFNSTKPSVPLRSTSNSLLATKDSKPSQGSQVDTAGKLASQPKVRVPIKPAEPAIKRQINEQPKTDGNQKRFKLADLLFAKKTDTEKIPESPSKEPKSSLTTGKQKPALGAAQSGNSKPAPKSLFSTLFSSTKSSAQKMSKPNPPAPEPTKKLNILERPKSLLSSQTNTSSKTTEKLAKPAPTSSTSKVSTFTPKTSIFESSQNKFIQREKPSFSGLSNPFERLTKGTFSSSMKTSQPFKFQQRKDQTVVNKELAGVENEKDTHATEATNPIAEQTLSKSSEPEPVKNVDQVEIEQNQPKDIVENDSTKLVQADGNNNQAQAADLFSTTETSNILNPSSSESQDKQQDKLYTIANDLNNTETDNEPQNDKPQKPKTIDDELLEQSNVPSISANEPAQLSLPQNETPAPSSSTTKETPSKKIRISRISTLPRNPRPVIISAKKSVPENNATSDLDAIGFKFGFGKRIINRTPQSNRTIVKETPFKKLATTKPSPFKVLSSKHSIKLPTSPTRSHNLFRRSNFEPTIPRSPPLSTRVRAKQVSLPIQEPHRPFKARPVNWKVLESRGDLGVPKINKRELTIPRSPKFNDRLRVHLPAAITRSPPPRRPHSIGFRPTVPKSPNFTDRLGVKKPLVLTRGPPIFKNKTPAFKPTVPKSPKFNDRESIRIPKVVNMGSPEFKRKASGFKPTIPKTPRFAMDRARRILDENNGSGK